MGPYLAVALAVCAWAAPASALVAVRSTDSGREFDLFGEHMVLQRDMNTPIWGTADPGEPVSVSIASQTHMTTADPQGKWRIELDPVPAGGPHVLTITGPSNTVVLDDILFGDVFLMAGQSNLMIKRQRDRQLAEYPDVRVFKRTWRDRPGGMPWTTGVQLHIDLGVPIGILQRCMRGSSGLIRTWMGPDAVNSTDPVVQEIVQSSDWGQSFEAVIRNVAGFGMKGLIWWQGESDTRSQANPGADYGQMLREVIRTYRVEWNQGDFPFFFLQEPLGGGYQPEMSTVEPLPQPPMVANLHGLMRNAYVESLSVPNTWMVTSGDLVSGLHPRDREGYKNRIVNTVLAKVYNHPITYAGPTYSSSSIEDGNKVRIKFRSGTATGLHARGGDLQGFEIFGQGQGAWANAVIEGDEVVVWADNVLNPTVVRYGYRIDYRFANLFNDAGMAAPTFQTTAQPHPE